MFFGLTLTSIVSLVMSTALFQRKSRSGWIDELDGIREEALAGPDHEVVNAIAPEGEDLWTDLRAGGQYTDPHEISSLYADDQTLPSGGHKPAKGRGRGRGRKDAEANAPEPVADAPVTAPIEEPVRLAPPIVGTPIHHHELAPAAAVADDIWTAAIDEVPTGTVVVPEPAPGEPLWVQPAPHPMRPSEMWHPAESVVTPLAPEAMPEPAAAQEVAEPVAPAAAAPIFEAVGSVGGPATPIVPTAVPVADEGALPAWQDEFGVHAVVAPVGRRVRRDRPSYRRGTLPAAPGGGGPLGPSDDAVGPAPLPQRGDTSPLREAPLPPAALPSPAARLPLAPAPSAGDAPAAPVPPAPPAFEQALEEAFGALLPTEPLVEDLPVADHAYPVAEAPIEDLSVFSPVEVVEAPIEDLSAFDPAPEPTAEQPIEPTPLAPGEGGLVPVAGLIVRLGGAAQADAAVDHHGPTVSLREGWTWVAPGDGPGVELRVDLPAGRITFAPEATGLAVVEHDGSSFVIVASGTGRLDHADTATVLGEGAIAMIDPVGSVQVDQATQDEVIADPVVELNLSLDAEL